MHGGACAWLIIRSEIQIVDVGKRLPMDIPKEGCYLICNGQRKG
jgi:hypothetical protein